MICEICPRYCDLHDGQTGPCRSRKQEAGKNVPVSWGEVASLSVEPIEKKPLYHFRPKTKCLSVGLTGCPLFCKFCENFQISQNSNNVTKHYEPSELVSLAKEKKVDGISFSHNEPILYPEYISAVSEISEDLYVTVKTSGFVTQSNLEALMPYVDAWNIDIKGDEESYRKICKGELSPVLETIQYLTDSKKHVEISFIVVPVMINKYEFHNNFRDLVANNDNIKALHLLCYYPAYKMLEKTYEIQRLFELFSYYKEKVDNVYIPNSIEVKPEHRNTVCRNCKEIIVKRMGEIVVYSHSCKVNIV